MKYGVSSMYAPRSGVDRCLVQGRQTQVSFCNEASTLFNHCGNNTSRWKSRPVWLGKVAPVSGVGPLQFRARASASFGHGTHAEMRSKFGSAVQKNETDFGHGFRA